MFFWVHDNAKMQACQIQSCVWNEQMAFIAFSEVCNHLKRSAVLFPCCLFGPRRCSQNTQICGKLGSYRVAWPDPWMKAQYLALLLYGVCVFCPCHTCKVEEVGETAGFSCEGGVWNVTLKYRVFSYKDSSVRNKFYLFFFFEGCYKGEGHL